MEEIKASLQRYVEHHIEPGGFLRAVLENDLFTAVGKADYINIHKLHEICVYIYNVLPITCWGSPEKVEEWLQNKPKSL